MGKPRIAVPGGTLAVTRRTNERKFLFAPATPEVHRGYLYALAIAQEREGVAVHHGTLQSNHEHLCITPGLETDIGEVFRILHRESACFVQESLLSRGYDAPQKVWDGRPTHAMHLIDAGAILEWVLYTHLNAVKAGLVARAEAWPGWLSDLGLLKGGTVVVERPDQYFSAKKHPAQRELVFSAPPELARMFGSDLEGVVYWLRKAVRAQERSFAQERVGSVVGAATLQRIHPFAEPATPRERRRRRLARFKVGRGWQSERCREMVEHLEGEDGRFLAEYAAAKRAWVGGDREVVFPFGSLQMVNQHGAAMAPAHPDAVLCASDRTLTEGGSRRLPAEAVMLASDAALKESRAEVSRAEVSRAEVSRAEEPPRPTPAVERVDVEHRGLGSPTKTATGPHARRLVILRTRVPRGDGSREPES